MVGSGVVAMWDEGTVFEGSKDVEVDGPAGLDRSEDRVSGDASS